MTPEERESRKTVRTFALASFLNDFGSDIIYPIWPLFVTSVFGANMAVLGFIDGLGDAVVSLSQAGSGYLSDRLRKRKIFIWLGYLFGSLSRIGYAFSTAWQHLIPFRIFDRMGKIRSAPRDAIIADVSTDENRGRNFGILRSMDNFGAVCGILFCIAFFDLGYKTLFLLAAIPSALGVLLILVFIRETPSLGSRIYKGLSIRQLDANFRLFIFLSSCFALGSFSYSFLLLYGPRHLPIVRATLLFGVHSGRGIVFASAWEAVRSDWEKGRAAGFNASLDCDVPGVLAPAFNLGISVLLHSVWPSQSRVRAGSEDACRRARTS